MHAPLTDEPSMRAWLDDALEARDAGTEQPFATVALASGRVVGSTRYMAIVPAHRRLEIGWTWLTPSAQGGGANTEAKLLMLAHAFEDLGAMRVELKTDALNVRSRAALARDRGDLRGNRPAPPGHGRRPRPRLGLVCRRRRGLAGGAGSPPRPPRVTGRS